MKFDNQDSTIQQDVQNESGNGGGNEQTPETRQLTPREEALARIEQVNMEAVEKQNADYRQAYGLPEEPTPEEGRQESGQTPAAVQQDVEPKVQVKVDGEEMELPVSEVVKNYQKVATADKRLKEAALRLQEVEAREKALEGKAFVDDQDTALPSVDTDEDMRAGLFNVVNSIEIGDTETAVEELAKLLGSSVKQAESVIDENRVNEAVELVLRQKEFDREFTEAQQDFMKNHADLNNNPTLAAMVNAKFDAAIEAGMFPKDATQKAVSDVREFVAGLTGNNNNNNVSRQERKQTYDTIRSATGRVNLNDQGNEDTSTSSVVAEMKRLRGQA